MNAIDSDIQNRLMILFEKYAHEKATPESQMCLYWSTDDPPDTLQCTESLEAIESEFNISLTEMESVNMYDMCLADASNFIKEIRLLRKICG